MIILGIDPGLDRTGWAILKKEGATLKLLNSGLIHTKASTPLPERLEIIFDNINSITLKWKPAAAAIEEMFLSKKASTQAHTVHARGVILLACKKAGLSICSYNPKTIKKNISGNGSADKLQMQKIVKMILNLKNLPKPDDVADAMAAALCHARTQPLMQKIKTPGNFKLWADVKKMQDIQKKHKVIGRTLK
ncbi:MAG: crossover junction endodeoxyribonuclease RuvC [Elusimicrobiota bacterium]|nr:crossover junction endodeoxyribonuclease RuvC [Elusimicrobiota bacterium]